MSKLFKIGDKVRNKADHTYKGTVTKTKYVPNKGLKFGDFQWLYLDGSNVPSGATSEHWELDDEIIDNMQNNLLCKP